MAGLIFGFAPYHFTHLTHIQLQWLPRKDGSEQALFPGFCPLLLESQE